MSVRKTLTPAIVAGAMLLLAACGSDPTATPTPQNTAVSVDLTEWTVEPSVTQSGGGDVTFVVSNKGSLEHEFVVLKTDTPASDLTIVDGKIDESAEGTLIGEIEPDELQPGRQASATYTLESGSYVLLCNITGHYGLGMRAGFAIAN